MDTTKYTALFLQEMKENCATLSTLFVDLEKTPNERSILEEIMRLSHSCKGLCATMTYQKTAELCHAMEDIFDAARKGELTMNSEIIDLSLEALDAVSASLQTIENTGGESESFPVMQAPLTLIKQQHHAPATSAPEMEKKSEKRPAAPATLLPSLSQVRVSTKKLDALLELAGELTLLRQQLALECARSDNASMAAFLEQYQRLSEDLTYRIIESRLVPLEQAFMQFPRLVRDLARSEHKSVNFQMTGTDIELDKTLVDHLVSPLVHLLRNAVDHGIELPEERTQKAKNPEGTITLSVKRERGFAIVTVEDDGKTIEWGEVKELARKRGLPEEALEPIGDETLLKILCDPRFSSAQEVTEVSGRGVGLSAVQEACKSLGGHFTFEQDNTKKRFVITLPLQLSMIHTLLVESAEKTYAIPLVHVHRLLKVPASDVKRTLTKPAFVWEEQDVPLLPIAQALCDTTASTTSDTTLTVVLVRQQSDVVGLVVDRVIGNEVIMVKPVGASIKRMQSFSGSTILGNGTVALILDVISLLRSQKKQDSPLPS